MTAAPAPTIAMPLGPAHRLRVALERYGVSGLTRMIARHITRSTAPCFTRGVRARLSGGRGLEIGGPSSYLFGRGGLLPVYPLAARVDNVNFAAGRTTWESVVEGETFVFDPAKEPGRQFVAEATDLAAIPDGSYDFVLSSHTIEHSANPLRALKEWRRVLRPGALLILVAPDPTRTFDRRRPVTTIEHLAADEARGTAETDLTHLDEILKLHDLTLDPWAPQDAPGFEARSRRNAELRCLHHHVFDLALLRQAVERAGFDVLGSARSLPNHLITIAESRR
jgi:SAM-dependent methyltransferase